MQSRLRKTFNVSVAEVAYNDKWQSAKLAVASVSNTKKHAYQVIQSVVEWLESNFPDVLITHQEIEIL